MSHPGLTVRPPNGVLSVIHKKHKKKDAVLTRATYFARYPKNLRSIISIIWLTLAILSFTSADSAVPMTSFLGLAGAVAFAISAIALGRGEQDGPTSGKARD
ncbi:MAG: hypothetical protein CMQ14_02545 [Gammaproteobacteria bacterium]|nr:hypothetical protein [Gammaproteobacteria bacterium]